MDKKCAKYFSQYAGLTLDKYPIVERVEDVETESDIAPLLEEIFSVDPETGQPRGDIQYFMSKTANPTVKAFIEQVFFQPRATLKGYDPKTVSDDLIAEFSRGADESVEDYGVRLIGIRDKALADYEAIKAKNAPEMNPR